MRNEYPGICYRCKKLVKKRDGHFEIIPSRERIGGIKWRLQHASCAIKFRGTTFGKYVFKNSI